ERPRSHSTAARHWHISATSPTLGGSCRAAPRYTSGQLRCRKCASASPGPSGRSETVPSLNSPPGRSGSARGAGPRPSPGSRPSESASVPSAAPARSTPSGRKPARIAARIAARSRTGGRASSRLAPDSNMGPATALSIAEASLRPRRSGATQYRTETTRSASRQPIAPHGAPPSGPNATMAGSKPQSSFRSPGAVRSVKAAVLTGSMRYTPSAKQGPCPRVKPFARSVQNLAFDAFDDEAGLLGHPPRGLVAHHRAPVDAPERQLLEAQTAQAPGRGRRPAPAPRPRRAEVAQLGLPRRVERELDRSAVAVLLVGHDVQDRPAAVPRAASAPHPLGGVLPRVGSGQAHPPLRLGVGAARGQVLDVVLAQRPQPQPGHPGLQDRLLGQEERRLAFEDRVVRRRIVRLAQLSGDDPAHPAVS